MWRNTLKSKTNNKLKTCHVALLSPDHRFIWNDWKDAGKRMHWSFCILSQPHTHKATNQSVWLLMLQHCDPLLGYNTYLPEMRWILSLVIFRGEPSYGIIYMCVCVPVSVNTLVVTLPDSTISLLSRLIKKRLDLTAPEGFGGMFLSKPCGLIKTQKASSQCLSPVSSGCS